MSPRPRTFHLHRYEDLTGVSGTGVVAWGVQWPDGTATTRWDGEHACTAVWSSVDEVIAVHGHGGSTVVKWHDGQPDAASELTRLRLALAALGMEYVRDAVIPTFLVRRAIAEGPQ